MYLEKKYMNGSSNRKAKLYSQSSPLHHHHSALSTHLHKVSTFLVHLVDLVPLDLSVNPADEVSCKCNHKIVKIQHMKRRIINQYAYMKIQNRELIFSYTHDQNLLLIWTIVILGKMSVSAWDIIKVKHYCLVLKKKCENILC